MLDGLVDGAVMAASLEPMAGAGIFIALVVIGLVLLGAPLFVVIGGLAFACLAAYPLEPDAFTSIDGFAANFNLVERIVELVEKKEFVAIPFFMIAGAIMSRGAIARRLVAFANALFAWLPGGLALSTIAACMFFAAISGSSPVTVITIGAIMLPALQKAGYGDNLPLGLVTSAGSLGIIIPPSIPMIVYAIFASSTGARVDVEDLFIAGIGPGLVIGMLLAGYCIVMGRGVERESFEPSLVVETFLDGIWSLFLPFFILGGIYLGLFNATEASAISVVLALVIELWIHRSLTVDDLPGILGESAVLMGAILIIIGVAFGFSEFMSIHEVPELIVAWLFSFDLTPITFILLLNVLLLIVGCLMDIISAIILFVPLIAPIASLCGFDPVHVGLIFIVNLEIGYLTPPLGLNLFVASSYFEAPFGKVIRAIAPFLLLLVVGLVIVTTIPTVSLGVLNLRDGKPLWTPFPTEMVCEGPEAGVAEDALLNDVLDGGLGDALDAEPEAGEGGMDGEEKSIQELMNDPAFRDLVDDELDAGEEEDDLEPLPELDDEGEEEEEEEKSIQELMNDPSFRELVEDELEVR